ncbi:MAG TPA: phosphoenolpyruvate-utilizing N-terminal domain-containing protein, partial [Rhodothermales bacterium]|nr:phosphoenolpyruvate-utilizing N-terminal domain-containing protein [Rhodothermales bacterium]
MPFSAAPDSEVVLEGVPVSPGIVCAPAYVYAREHETVEERRVDPDEVPAERQRFEEAVERSERDLAKVTTLAREKLGDEHAAIFEAQALMLRDMALYDAVVDAIESDHVGADFAVHQVLSRHRELLLAADGEHFRERAADLTDLEQRLLVHLRRGKMISQVDEGAIVVAPTLTAADVVLFARRGIRGMVLQYGGATSHVSIMARALGLPAVVGLRDLTRHVEHGELLVLDGLRGRVIAGP